MGKREEFSQYPPGWVIHATWAELNDGVKNMSEKEALDAIETEGSTYRRKSYLLRLHSRYNLLRGQRERQQLADLSRTPHGGH